MTHWVEDKDDLSHEEGVVSGGGEKHDSIRQTVTRRKEERDG